MLIAKRVLLGVSGSIAAYQAADLIGLLKEQMASVRVIMTRAATQFITPLTLEIISGNPVSVEMFGQWDPGTVEHIALGTGADLLIMAPATANIIGKIANGIADDMLSTTALAVTCPVLIAPAMNERMWLNPIVQTNVRRLTELGVCFAGPEYGAMACGGEGWGRLAGLASIVRAASELVGSAQQPVPDLAAAITENAR
jgi:phosphopantothenoylcysteine decarboxylase/phosphopantothenate--cysteine ligase